MKIIVYTIMKNELHNIEKWLENVSDADSIYVLDTGSTDGSYELMLSMKDKYSQLIVEQQVFDPFRFDDARNRNLEMVPEGRDTICWTIDLDERFCSDWYQITKEAFETHPNFYKFKYKYAPTHSDSGEPLNIQIYDKCHQRLGAYWEKPIHEWLLYKSPYQEQYVDGYVEVAMDKVLVHHYKNEKTDRNQYIDLLKQRLEDNPYDVEALHHLTSEMCQRGESQRALDLLFVQYSRGLKCKCSWMEVICGNIAEALWNAGEDPEDIEPWFKRAIKYNPSLRSYYLSYAEYLCYGSPNSRPQEAFDLLQEMKLKAVEQPIEDRWKDSSSNWTWRPLDIEGIAYSWAGDYVNALKLFEKALPETIQSQDRELVESHIQFCKDKLQYIENITTKSKLDNKAYVTVLANNSYINGLVVMHRSLQATGTKYPLYAIVTPDVSQENREVLKALDIGIIEKEQLIAPKSNRDQMVENIERLEQPGWHAALVKLEIFNLTQFSKIVYLDADLYIMKNIDDLFERPHLSAVQDLCGFVLDDPNNHKNFNSGVMVVEPGTEDYQALIGILNNHDFGDRLIHDQLIMWEYWKDWADRKELHLPNYYNIWTSYFWPEDPYFAYPHDIKVLHIIDKKPWLQSKEYFRQFDNSYHIYMLLNLWYIDVLNWTIEDLRSKGITSPDLKIIK